MKPYLNLIRFWLSIIISAVIYSFPQISIAQEIVNSPEYKKYTDILNMSNGDIIEYEAGLNSYLTKYPTDDNAILLKIKLAVRDSTYSDAINQLDNLHPNFSKLADAYYLLSRIFALRDSVEKATTSFYTLFDYLIDDNLFNELESDAIICMTKNEIEAYKASESKLRFLQNFWKVSDPTPATIENEFLITIFSRVEYSFRHFTLGENLDERGDIYLRFGQPDIYKKFSHYNHDTECWIYYSISDKPLFFDFIRTSESPNYILIRKSQDIEGDKWSTYAAPETDLDMDAEVDGINTFLKGSPSKHFFNDRVNLDPYYTDLALKIFSAEMDQLQSLVPTYLTKFDTELLEQRAEMPAMATGMDKYSFTLPLDYARFKNNNNSIRLENYYAFPFSISQYFQNKESPDNIILNMKFAVKDTTFNFLFNSEEIVNFSDMKSSQSFFEECSIVNVDPGNYLSAIEIEDTNSRYLGTNQLFIHASDFLSDKLFTSDIQISTEIASSSEQNISYKNDLVIKPYPYSYINKNDPFFIYFEIYNLQTIDSNTNFEVTYTIENEKETNIFEEFIALLGSNSTNISFTQIYDGNSIDDFLYFQLDCSNLETGSAKLIIEVEDLWTGETFTREKHFSFIE